MSEDDLTAQQVRTITASVDIEAPPLDAMPVALSYSVLTKPPRLGSRPSGITRARRRW
jgi:hypothetical protein